MYTHLSSQSSGSSQCSVNRVGSVRGADHYKAPGQVAATFAVGAGAGTGGHAIQKSQQLDNHAFGHLRRVVSARAQRVHFVQEHDCHAGSVLGSTLQEGTRVVEHVTQLALTLADKRTQNLLVCGRAHHSTPQHTTAHHSTTGVKGSGGGGSHGNNGRACRHDTRKQVPPAVALCV